MLAQESKILVAGVSQSKAAAFLNKGIAIQNLQQV
jgi:hypothetical protein